MSQTVGRFQAADRATLFLDEVGDLPLELQPKLLRALQEQQIERLGSGGRATSVDVRVIAATNQDLEEMVQQRSFRADFFRLNVFPVRVPPLRERTDDIPLLVAHFATLQAANWVLGTDPVWPPDLGISGSGRPGVDSSDIHPRDMRVRRLRDLCGDRLKQDLAA